MSIAVQCEKLWHEIFHGLHIAMIKIRCVCIGPCHVKATSANDRWPKIQLKSSWNGWDYSDVTWNDSGKNWIQLLKPFWHSCKETNIKMYTFMETDQWPTCKYSGLAHRQDAQSRQRYEHISSLAGSRATGHSARLTRSWVTLVLTTPYEGRRHQLSCCYRETDVTHGHDKIRESICRQQIT